MNKLTSKDFIGMISSGAANLENHEKEINALNVFPVPDGDTGTNMTMTFNNGYNEASGSLSNSVGDIAKALSKGLLMGARGNSGVITSQIFRGFAKASEGKEQLTVYDLSNGFIEGARVAYKAIMKPVEGTILTVIKEAAYYSSKELENNKDLSINEYISLLTKFAKESLDNTPNLLPTLKEAGVVDSGGAGLYRIFEGFDAYLNNQPIIKKEIANIELTAEAADEDYIGYDIKLTLLLNQEYRKNFDTSIVSKRLSTVSDIVNVDVKQNTIDIKVKTIKPGEVLNVLQRYGEFNTITIDNLFKNEDVEDIEEKEYGLIAVAAGEGITQLFYDLGCDAVISGGQTMNPSTQDFLNYISKLNNCKTIFIFPNNSNIILAAEQAKSLAEKDVIVIPSKSIQAGLSALTLFDPDDTKINNEHTLTEAALKVKTAQITYAVKDTIFEGVEVKQGDYISIVGKTIIDSSNDLKDLINKTVDYVLKDSGGELLTVIAGEGSSEDINNYIIDYVSNTKNFEADLIQGDQPVYAYLFGLE